MMEYKRSILVFESKDGLWLVTSCQMLMKNCQTIQNQNVSSSEDHWKSFLCTGFKKNN